VASMFVNGSGRN